MGPGLPSRQSNEGASDELWARCGWHKSCLPLDPLAVSPGRASTQRRENMNKLVLAVLAAFALSTAAPALADDVSDLAKVQSQKGGKGGKGGKKGGKGDKKDEKAE